MMYIVASTTAFKLVLFLTSLLTILTIQRLFNSLAKWTQGSTCRVNIKITAESLLQIKQSNAINASLHITLSAIPLIISTIIAELITHATCMQGTRYHIRLFRGYKYSTNVCYQLINLHARGVLQRSRSEEA